MNGRRVIAYGLAALGLFLLAAPAVLAATSGAHAAPAGGIRGLVKQSAGGVCAADEPCDGVGRNMLLAFSRPGQPDARVRSTASGTFRISLRPGRYQVRAVAAPPLQAAPAAITVPASGWAIVVLRLGAAKHAMISPGG
ncbi:MAG: hypothetical protein H0X39_14860 [Actinobacteria bacterium]|nr:hypothetical protein [Actinomycetota bacterium]